MGRWRRAAYGYACCLLRKARATDPRRVHRAVPEADRGISFTQSRTKRLGAYTRNSSPSASTCKGRIQVLNCWDGSSSRRRSTHCCQSSTDTDIPQRLERRHNEISAYCSRTGRTYPHADALRPKQIKTLIKQAGRRTVVLYLWITLALKGVHPCAQPWKKPLWITISFIPRLRSEGTASTPVLDNLLPAGETRSCWASSSYAQKSAVPRALTVSIL